MSTRTLLEDPDIQHAITVRVRQPRRSSAVKRLGFIVSQLNTVQLDSLIEIAQHMATPELQVVEALIRQLGDRDLCRYAYAEQNDLTTTPLERELLRRIERVYADGRLAILDQSDVLTRTEVEQLISDADDWGRIADDIIGNASNSARLLIALKEHDITDPDHLRAILDDRS